MRCEVEELKQAKFRAQAETSASVARQMALQSRASCLENRVTELEQALLAANELVVLEASRAATAEWPLAFWAASLGAPPGLTAAAAPWTVPSVL